VHSATLYERWNAVSLPCSRKSQTNSNLQYQEGIFIINKLVKLTLNDNTINDQNNEHDFA
jgi:hypothetical protein